jgi:hypothetical protein
LKKRGVAFVWDPQRVAAFEALREALCLAPVLAMPDWDADFILTTDWSCAAIGAVLWQRDRDTGEEHPIAFVSRALTAAERNYAPTEGECLAVKWAVDKFRYYLHGRKFTLRTDHQALVWLDSARFNNSKLERWALELQEYDFTVEYIKGDTNVVADHLSRACSCYVFWGALMRKPRFRACQALNARRCSSLCRIIACMQRGLRMLLGRPSWILCLVRFVAIRLVLIIWLSARGVSNASTCAV